MQKMTEGKILLLSDRGGCLLNHSTKPVILALGCTAQGRRKEREDLKYTLHPFQNEPINTYIWLSLHKAVHPKLQPLGFRDSVSHGDWMLLVRGKERGTVITNQITQTKGLKSAGLLPQFMFWLAYYKS